MNTCSVNLFYHVSHQTQHLNIILFSGDNKYKLVASNIGLQWRQLAAELGMTNAEIWEVEKDCKDADAGERSFLMLLRWDEMNKDKSDNGENFHVLN